MKQANAALLRYCLLFLSLWSDYFEIILYYIYYTFRRTRRIGMRIYSYIEARVWHVCVCVVQDTRGSRARQLFFPGSPSCAPNGNRCNSETYIRLYEVTQAVCTAARSGPNFYFSHFHRRNSLDYIRASFTEYIQQLYLYILYIYVHCKRV